MDTIKIAVLCTAAALLCTMLKVHRPEMATILSLAIGIAAILMCADDFREVMNGIVRFTELSGIQNEHYSIVLKAAGITIISELGVQICSDAGESALAGRIRLVTRVVMLAMAMPLVLSLMEDAFALFG